MTSRIPYTNCLIFSLLALGTFASPQTVAQETRPTTAPPQSTQPIPSISKKQIMQRMDDARKLFERGKTDAAIYLLQQVEKADPNNYPVLLKLGEMAIADKNWAYSITVLRKASLIRPKDVEVRLILLDIYKAYQMPIQGIIVAKEILAIDPSHIVATRRLAKLYHEQAMLEDEINTRKSLRRLVSNDYDNLKRLAVIYDNSGELWEAAQLYEEIRKFHPDKNQDLSRLAGIYDRLGESFRGLQVIDQLEKNGEDLGWLEERSAVRLRQQSEIHDHFTTGLDIRSDKSDELKSTSTNAGISYKHLSLRSSFDYALDINLKHDTYKGLNDLAGDLKINNGTFTISSWKNWQGEDYQLMASIGALWDGISGKLSLRDSSSGLTAADYALLKDPRFESSGGTMAIGRFAFIAQPGLHNRYQASISRGQIEDLDALLQMLSQNKFALDYLYQSNDLTTIEASADSANFSDNNTRSHASLGGSYVLWGNDAMRDYTGRRKGFLRLPLRRALSIGFMTEYFKDKERSILYESFDAEHRHKATLGGQFRIYRRKADQSIFMHLTYEYSTGTTLDSQHNADLRVFYFNADNSNEMGISIGYEKSRVKDSQQQNKNIVGESKAFVISADAKLRF